MKSARLLFISFTGNSLTYFLNSSSENHVIVGELLETKSAQHADLNTPKSMVGDVNWNGDSEAHHDTGGYSIGFSLTVLQVYIYIYIIATFVDIISQFVLLT